jgi:hypothetical protein
MENTREEIVAALKQLVESIDLSALKDDKVRGRQCLAMERACWVLLNEKNDVAQEQPITTVTQKDVYDAKREVLKLLDILKEKEKSNVS